MRDRVRIRADGGIKTGFDVVAVLALGADEVSLGTALMVAEQCIFCHGCANGMCPAGITTQSDLVARRLMTLKKARPADVELPDEEELRYEDAREAVKRYLLALAGDVRARLAAAGLRHPGDLVGRVDLLERKELGEPRKDKIDLAEVLLCPDEGARSWADRRAGRAGDVRGGSGLRVDPVSAVNTRIVEAIAAGQARIELEVDNGDRAVGATAAGKVALGELALPAARLHAGAARLRRAGAGLRARRRLCASSSTACQRRRRRGHGRRHPGGARAGGQRLGRSAPQPLWQRHLLRRHRRRGLRRR